MLTSYQYEKSRSNRFEKRSNNKSRSNRYEKRSKNFFFEKNVFSLFDSANEIISLQTNDILIFADQKFANAKKKSDC